MDVAEYRHGENAASIDTVIAVLEDLYNYHVITGHFTPANTRKLAVWCGRQGISNLLTPLFGDRDIESARILAQHVLPALRARKSVTPIQRAKIERKRELIQAFIDAHK